MLVRFIVRVCDLMSRLLTDVGCVCAALRNACPEVGQALLQRHEAYVCRHPRTDEDKTRLEGEVDELRSQNASLERVNPDYMLSPLTLPTLTDSFHSGLRGRW